MLRSDAVQLTCVQRVGLHSVHVDAGEDLFMTKLAIAAALAAGLAVTAPIQARAHDGFGPALLGGLVAGAIIGGAAAPYGYYGRGYAYGPGYGYASYGPGYGYDGPVYGYYRRPARVYYGPNYAREVVYAPRRIRRGYVRSYPVNYYYGTSSYYRGYSVGWGW
jgi:hypothetical protein